jgi:hypothetical protein
MRVAGADAKTNRRRGSARGLARSAYDLNGNGEISEYEFGEYIAQLPD